MAKKTRGGGHKHQRPHRPASSSRVSVSHSAPPAVGTKRMDRRVIFGLVAVVVVVLLGSVLVLGRPSGSVAAPTDAPIVVAGASTTP